MAQLDLLGSKPLTLVDDHTGLVTYASDVIDRESAAGWFDALLARIDWPDQRREMYGRVVDVPRRTAHFVLGAADTTACLMQAARIAEAQTGAVFNSVGLNLYRNGSDSVAPHNDHLEEIVPGSPIALLSLGATRRMIIRSKQPPRRNFQIDLDAGSLLVMSYASQKYYDHGVPKTRTATGPRISFAFRCRPVSVAQRAYRAR
ncbi:MAG: alpha-ketoglutarate-dependent dioxygenase AlkB [Rhodanobacteraceae bacterium]